MKVREIMTSNVFSVMEETPVREVAQLLDRHRISGVPVCDGQGHMVGLITEYDLIAKPDARSAGEAMTRDVVSVMEDTGGRRGALPAGQSPHQARARAARPEAWSASSAAPTWCARSR